jgi:hypothetical protein
VIGELRDRGCEAGGYRLAGATFDQLCCRHLYADDRMIVAWPAEDHAVVIAIGPHDGSNNDVYALLLDALDRRVPPDERDKPPCCDEQGLPPLDPQTASELADALKRVERVRRRSR